MKRAGLTILAIVGVIFVGRATVSRPATTHTERVIEQRSVEPRVVQTRGLGADEVREIVRSELADTAPTREAPPAADAAALERARAAVDAGLADGRWTEDDRQRLRQELPALQQVQLDEVLALLFARLPQAKVELDGPPA